MCTLRTHILISHDATAGRLLLHSTINVPTIGRIFNIEFTSNGSRKQTFLINFHENMRLIFHRTRRRFATAFCERLLRTPGICTALISNATTMSNGIIVQKSAHILRIPSDRSIAGKKMTRYVRTRMSAYCFKFQRAEAAFDLAHNFNSLISYLSCHNRRAGISKLVGCRNIARRLRLLSRYLEWNVSITFR